MKLTKKQLEKVADQFRLLSWAQGAIITSTSGLHFDVKISTAGAVILNWLAFQILALFLDKWSEK